jgi:hypothetical protein
MDDATIMGKATVVGHLLECAGQITGGYYADPNKKPVEGMDKLGHPFADVFNEGSAKISKVQGTGGIINLATAKEQLLYEVINPNEYITPDVIADFTTVTLLQTGKDCVGVKGGGGRQKPATLKVSVGYKAGYVGEGEITYAGQYALERAQLAGETVRSRLQKIFKELRVDYIGCTSVHPSSLKGSCRPYEVRTRIVAKANTSEEAALIGEEVEALYTNGPAGGGGVRKYVTEVVGIISTLIDRNNINSSVIIRTT